MGLGRPHVPVVVQCILGQMQFQRMIADRPQYSLAKIGSRFGDGIDNDPRIVAVFAAILQRDEQNQIMSVIAQKQAAITVIDVV
jgi:hypothetical protein